MNSIPIIGTLYQWCSDWGTKRELTQAGYALQKLMKSGRGTASTPLTQRTLQLIERCKDSSSLKGEVAKLERAYMAHLSKTPRLLPSAYLAKENRALAEAFAKMGISQHFLLNHPEFLSAAKERFWQHYLPFVKCPIQMRGKELFLPIEQKENSGRYSWKSWSEIRKMNLDDFRVGYKGFAIGHPDRFKSLVPLKKVEAKNKYALQFVTTCPVGQGLPSSIDITSSGHSFTQMILPQEGTSQAEVYSVGFFPRGIEDLGFRPFKTVPGVYRNHDSNVSRIQAKQVIPLVKQYVFEKDAFKRPCLFSLAKHGKKLGTVTVEEIRQAMIKGDRKELQRMQQALTKVQGLIASGKCKVCIPPMDRREKMLTMMQGFEAAQGNHPYHLLERNCTAISFEQEWFATAFLDAQRDSAKPIVVYESQIDIRDHKWGMLSQIREVFERALLHLFAAFPVLGPLLGTGSVHSEVVPERWWISSLISETGFALHQLLTAAFNPRPSFPAGEVLARNCPVLEGT
jgi:hypothetical protein